MHRKWTIAIIEDDAQVREGLDNLLRAAGYATALYPSAEAFLEEVRSTEASVVVSDIHMRELSGLDLKMHLDERDIRLPIILITALFDHETFALATKAGAVACLGKPFNDEELLEAIKAAIPPL